LLCGSSLYIVTVYRYVLMLSNDIEVLIGLFNMFIR